MRLASPPLMGGEGGKRRDLREIVALATSRGSSSGYNIYEKGKRAHTI